MNNDNISHTATHDNVSDNAIHITTTHNARPRTCVDAQHVLLRSEHEVLPSDSEAHLGAPQLKKHAPDNYAPVASTETATVPIPASMCSMHRSGVACSLL
jgi:hypothetical protein